VGRLIADGLVARTLIPSAQLTIKKPTHYRVVVLTSLDRGNRIG